MKNISNENARNKQNEDFKNELEGSIVAFNQATEATRFKYINVVNNYLKNINQ